MKAPWRLHHRKKGRRLPTLVAVSEGFEPPVRCRPPVVEAGSFNHSDNSPVCSRKIKKSFPEKKLFISLCPGLKDYELQNESRINPR